MSTVSSTETVTKRLSRMKLHLLLVVIGLWQTVVTEETVDDKDKEWTSDDIKSLKSIMYDFFGEASQQDRAPGALRLAFHDCVGGCDGCLNLRDPANFGLEQIVADMEVLYQANIPFPPNAKHMSKADFYILAGIVSVEYSIDFNNRFCPNPPNCKMSQVMIAFPMGRSDCPTSPDTDPSLNQDFPHPAFNHEQLMEFWQDRFGMDPREVTAIMGGHTIGGFHKEASGYIGNWKEGGIETYSFNNDFYRLLLDPTFTWEHFDAAADSKRHPKLNSRSPSQRYQWKGINTDGEAKSFMADIDVDLILDLDIIDRGGESRCDFTSCPYSSTRKFAELYAEEADTWLHDFVCAYQKMTSAVPELLKIPKGHPVLPTKLKSGHKPISCHNHHPLQ